MKIGSGGFEPSGYGSLARFLTILQSKRMSNGLKKEAKKKVVCVGIHSTVSIKSSFYIENPTYRVCYCTYVCGGAEK